MTKEGLAARVVDRQQVHRTISKEEMLHLFEFDDDEEKADAVTEISKQNEAAHSQNTGFLMENSQKQKATLSRVGCYSDKLMENLLQKHSPR